MFLAKSKISIWQNFLTPLPTLMDFENKKKICRFLSIFTVMANIENAILLVALTRLD